MVARLNLNYKNEINFIISKKSTTKLKTFLFAQFINY